MPSSLSYPRLMCKHPNIGQAFDYVGQFERKPENFFMTIYIDYHKMKMPQKTSKM